MKVLKPTTIPFPSSGQFIRGSTATYIEDGVLKTAAINEPRWQDGKLFLEGEATNLLFPSEPTVAQLASTGGLSNAASVWPGFARSLLFASGSAIWGYLSTAIPPGQVYTLSVHVLISGGAPVFSSILSSSDGMLVSFGDAVAATTVQHISGDLYRVSFTGTSASGSASTHGVVKYAGNSTRPFWVMGYQLEFGAQSSYIPTTTAAVTRAADVCVGNFSRASTATYIDDNGVLQTAGVNVPRIQNGKLLVESSATNLILQSNSFNETVWGRADCSVISNNTVGPSGPNTASTFTFTGVDPYLFQQHISVVQGVKYTARFWVKGVGPTTTKNIEFLPWYNGTASGGIYPQAVPLSSVGRFVQFTFTAQSTGTLSFRIDLDSAAAIVGEQIVLSSIQLEIGETPTSYIPTTTTTVTRAADIHTAGLVYTNATDVRPLWSSATTYSTGQIIRYNNTVYESLQNTNLNRQPDTSPTWWLSLGADNISAAFDGKVGSKTTAVDKLRMIVYPGSVIDAVGYLETNAVAVNTSVVDVNRNLAYSNSTGFTESNIESWYDYFFVSPLADPATQVVHQGIPALDPNLVIGVELINPGTVELGSFLTGQSTTIGKTQYGLKAGIVDYSKKQADEFGNISIVERPYSKRMSGDVYVSNYDLNKVQRFLYNVRATPVLWMASDNPELAEVSYVYGFYKDFSTTISYPDVSMCNLDIEGLI